MQFIMINEKNQFGWNGKKNADRPTVLFMPIVSKAKNDCSLLKDFNASSTGSATSAACCNTISDPKLRAFPCRSLMSSVTLVSECHNYLSRQEF